MKIFILIFLFLFTTLKSEKVNNISVGDYLELSIDPSNKEGALYYQLILQESDLNDEAEIGVFVRPLDYRSDPDIYISTKEQYPTRDINEIKFI